MPHFPAHRALIAAVAVAGLATAGTIASLAGAATASPETLTVSPTASVSATTGAAVIRGTLRCATPASDTLTVTVVQTSGPIALKGDAFHVLARCGPKPIGWTARTLSLGGSFLAGKARVTVTASSANHTQTATVRIPKLPRTRYYVALGDSLVTGFASPPGQGYVPDLFAHYAPSHPGLTLVNLGCAGATTITFIKPSYCRYYGRLSQLQVAEKFLRAHRADLRLITIDIGGNDFIGCAKGPLVENTDCLNSSLNQVRANLKLIVTRLRAAAGHGVPIVSMSYFDAALGYWFSGDIGPAAAHKTVADVARITATIEGVYRAAGSPVADVAGAFQTEDFTEIDTPLWGPLPTNVARMCQWLDDICPAAGTVGTVGLGDDTNAAGSKVIAEAFERVIPPLKK